MIFFTKGHSSYGADMKLNLQQLRGNNSENMKARVVFLHAAHPHDLFYMTVQYHDNIPKGIQVIKQTRNCIKQARVVILVHDISS